MSNLKLVLFPNPYCEDPRKALRDSDIWGPFFFNVFFLGLTLSWSASVKKVRELEFELVNFFFIFIFSICFDCISLICGINACLEEFCGLSN